MKGTAALLLTILLAGLTGCAVLPGSGVNTKEDAAASDTEDTGTNAREESVLYTPDELIGTWEEKYDGSGRIEISESGSSKYAVKISRNTGTDEIHRWTMTAVPADSNILRYKDCTHTMSVIGDGGTETQEILYENGTGTITLLSTHELMWQDDVDDAGENAVFVNAE